MDWGSKSGEGWCIWGKRCTKRSSKSGKRLHNARASAKKESIPFMMEEVLIGCSKVGEIGVSCIKGNHRCL
jgi:hypothetical protein